MTSTAGAPDRTVAARRRPARGRILLLTQWCEPEPTFKGLVFARELVARGYEVEIVTGFPNYPGGKLYPGYRMSWRQRTEVDGVEVTRLPLYPSHDASALRRIANYASFAITSAVYCVLQARRADVVYVYQLLTLGGTAVLVKAIRGSRVVFDIQDIWPDTLRATGMVTGHRVLSAVGAFASWVYRRVDAIVVLSPGFRRLLLERGVPEGKINLIYNWCDERSLTAPGESDLAGFPGDDAFRVVFAGNMGKAQALSAVLDAAARVPAEHARIRFIFIGGGVEVERLKAEVAERRLANVVFIPRVPMDKIGAYLRAADVLLVHLKADPLFAITIPGKTQAYMAMGKPILMAAPGDAATLIREAGCGVGAAPEDAESIATAAIRLATLPPDELVAMGRRAKAYYDTHLGLAVGTDRFARVFDRVLGR